MTVRDVPAFLGKDVREPNVTTGGGLPAWLVIRFGENRQRCRLFSWLGGGFKNSKSQLELMNSSNSSRVSMSSVMMGLAQVCQSCLENAFFPRNSTILKIVGHYISIIL